MQLFAAFTIVILFLLAENSAVVEYPDMLNVSSSGIAKELRSSALGIYEMVKDICAEGRPVWKHLGQPWHFYYKSNQWWIGSNYNEASGAIKSEKENLTKIPSIGWLVQNKSAETPKAYKSFWDSDPSLTITDAGTSATTTTLTTGNSVVSGEATVTQSPIKMELLDEYLTSQLDCPPENLQDQTTNRSVQDPTPQPPAIDLFLNPNR